jgi:type VI secretion system protein VasD
MSQNSFFRYLFAGCPGFDRLALAVLCALLFGCGSAPPAPREAKPDLRMQVVAADNVNPDDNGRAAPIMVRVYELKSDTAFRNADFFSLQDNDRKAIGDDLLAVDEFVLRPGEKKTIERKANSATTAIGVMAGYRNLGKSVWRSVYPWRDPPKTPWYRRMFKRDGKEMLTVRVGRQSISVLIRRGDKWVLRTGGAD